MKLEKKIACYLDLGVSNYMDTFRLQERFANRIKDDDGGDVILISEHFPLVNFGMRDVHNNFSDYLYSQLEKKKLDKTYQNAIDYLKSNGISFSRSSRGGGATFIGKGQLNIYPIVNYQKIVKGSMNIEKYKYLIDDIMNNVLRSYGLDTHIANDIRKDDPDAFKRDRKDVWLEKENVHYKLGGKGIHTSGPVAYHGFNFYVKKGSTFGFKFVNPCGYTNDELKTTSVEEALGKEISMDDFKKSVLYEIKSQFKYDQIIKFGDFSNLV